MFQAHGGLREAQVRLGRPPRLDPVTAHVHEVLLDGAYELVGRLSPCT